MNIPPRKNKKTLIIPLLVIVFIVIVIVIGMLWAKNNNPQSTSTNNQNTTQADKDTNNTANSETEKDNTSSDASPKPPSDTVGVIVVDASQYDNIFEVRAYANATEAGTCTYTFAKDGKVITKKSNANSGPSTASCETLDVPVAELSKGNWDLTIKYTSTSNSFTGSTKATISIK